MKECFLSLTRSTRAAGIIQTKYRVSGKGQLKEQARAVEVGHCLPLHPEREVLFDNFPYPKKKILI